MPKKDAAAEVGEHDALYKPFPSFAAWSAVGVDAASWDGFVAMLEAATDEELLARGRDEALRAAAFDTGAVEGLYATDRGFTLSVARQEGHWEENIDARGPDARSLFEAQLATYRHMAEAARSEEPITEALIRTLHKELTSPQLTYTVVTPAGRQNHPLEHGAYKKYPNHVQLQNGAVHAYAPVAITKDEMARLVTELRSDLFGDAHPLLQASYAHYAITVVHPFADGNGRVARALASYYFFRAIGVPFLLFIDQRDEYLDALAAADGGNFDAFVGLASRRAVDAVLMVLDSMRPRLKRQPREIVERLHDLVSQKEQHQSYDAYAIELAGHLVDVTKAAAAALALPSAINHTVSPVHGSSGKAPAGYRLVLKEGQREAVTTGVAFTLALPPPYQINQGVSARVVVASDWRQPVTLQVISSAAEVPSLPVPASELKGGLSGSLRVRLGAFVDAMIAAALEPFETAVREKYQGTGMAIPTTD